MIVLKIKHNGSWSVRRSMDVIFIKEQWRTKCTTTTSNILMCIVRNYSCVLFGKERVIPFQGIDSKSFLHRTLTKSSNRLMMIDQASQTTILMSWHISTSLFNLYIKDWKLEERTRLYNILQVSLLCQNHYASNT